jgi:very-short-patch-repair endonuclease
MPLAQLLEAHRILYEIEKIFLTGDRHILADFYIHSAMLVIEVDGSAYDTQKSCDADRDRWLHVQYGIRTLRITNDEIIKARHIALHKINEARGVSKPRPIGDKA